MVGTTPVPFTRPNLREDPDADPGRGRNQLQRAMDRTDVAMEQFRRDVGEAVTATRPAIESMRDKLLGINAEGTKVACDMLDKIIQRCEQSRAGLTAAGEQAARVVEDFAHYAFETNEAAHHIVAALDDLEKKLPKIPGIGNGP